MFLVVVRHEGGFREVWDMPEDKARDAFRKVKEGGELESGGPLGGVDTFRPTFVALAEELENFDTVLGRAR